MDDALTMHAIQNTMEFDSAYRATMGFTPGRALVDAAQARADQAATLGLPMG